MIYGGRVMELKEYKNKKIIAYLWYDSAHKNYNGAPNRVCYVYPRILVSKDGQCEYIDPNDFPRFGGIRIDLPFRGSDEETAENLRKECTSLVSIQIKVDDAPSGNDNNKYILTYKKKNLPDSDISIRKFEGKNFYQIIDIEKNLDVLKSDRTIEKADIITDRLCTTNLLLRNGDKLYGPFAYNEEVSTIELLGIREQQYLIGEYLVADYSDDIYEIENQNSTVIATFMPQNVLCSPAKCERHEDWLSDERLVDGLIEFMKAGGTHTREQLRNIGEVILPTLPAQKNLLSIEFTEDRVQRIQQLLHNASIREDFTNSVVKFALEDEEYKKCLIDELIDNYFEDIKDKIPEYSKAKEELSSVLHNLDRATKSLEELKAKREDLEKSVMDSNESRIQELEKENALLQQQNGELLQKAGLNRTITDLQEEIKQYQKDRNDARVAYDALSADKTQLKEELKEVIAGFNTDAKKAAQVLESELLKEIRQTLLLDKGSDKYTNAKFDENLLCEPLPCNEIVQRVTDYIQNTAKRDVEYNDVANYLICISQGFITTFAGDPGTGKTSLCNILAKALGLATSDEQNRFIDISVERGWTSHKDFIGYYNPLTKEVEKSKADVFDAFTQLNEEYYDNSIQYAPYFILLDEANLSPIEHYWAAFLKLCDKDSTASRIISLGGKVQRNIPEHLRFLATVNFDHTTEELSPRFLDRSWVITLNPARISEDSDDIPANFEDMVPFLSLKDAFCATEDDSIDEAIQDKWSVIQTIFEENNLPIMPRNLKMVRKYCAAACKCMDRDTPATKLAPLDYALSQKILPTINGSGDNYKSLIDDLIDKCPEQSMPLSAKHLARMKSAAEKNLGFYQFFAR